MLTIGDIIHPAPPPSVQITMARNPIFAIIWLVLLFFLAWPIAAACAGVSRSVVSCHTAALLYYYVHSLCVRPRVCQTLARTDRHLYRPFLFPCSQFASLPYEYPPASVYQLWIILQVSLHMSKGLRSGT